MAKQADSFRRHLNKAIRGVSGKFETDLASLVSTQKFIKRELEALKGKTDADSRKYKNDLISHNQRITQTLTEISKEFEKMGKTIHVSNTPII